MKIEISLTEWQAIRQLFIANHYFPETFFSYLATGEICDTITGEIVAHC